MERGLGGGEKDMWRSWEEERSRRGEEGRRGGERVIFGDAGS